MGRVLGLLVVAATAVAGCAPPLPRPAPTTVTQIVEAAPTPTSTTPARMSNEELSEQVKASVQYRLMEVPELAKYTLQVQDVTVVKESENQYVGLVYVKPPMGEAHRVEVDVMYDGSDVLVRFADPSDFDFVNDLPTR